MAISMRRYSFVCANRNGPLPIAVSGPSRDMICNFRAEIVIDQCLANISITSLRSSIRLDSRV